MVLNIMESLSAKGPKPESFSDAVLDHIKVASQYSNCPETRELKTAVDGLITLGCIGYANKELRKSALSAFTGAAQFATFHAGTRQAAVTGLVAIAQDAFVREDWETAHRAMQPAQKYMLGTSHNRTYVESYQNWVNADEPKASHPAALLFKAARADNAQFDDEIARRRARAANAVNDWAISKAPSAT